MGKFDFTVSEDFLKTLGKLSDIDKVAPQMISEALPTCSEYLRRGIESADHPYSKGQMVKSIQEGKPSQERNGAWKGVTRPTGKDSKGVRNMEKLAYYEYGTSHHGVKHQPARPIMDRIKNDASLPAQEKMAEVFKREMGLK